MVNTLGSTVTFEVKDKFGFVTEKMEIECNSLLRAFQRLLYGLAINTNQSIVDTTNTAVTVYLSAANVADVLNMVSGAGVLDRNIVIGSGSAAVAINNYAIETLIAEGTGSGQMNYGASTPTHTEDAAEDYVQVQRSVTNNSGAEITVNEVALYTYATISGGGHATLCIARDLTGGVVVPNLSSITVTYKIKVVL